MKIIALLITVILPFPVLAGEPQTEQPEQQPALQRQALQREKLPDDPTKVVTKLGVGYTDQFSLKASVSLDDTHKINLRIGENGDEWRLGGSWLFEFGILNVNFGRTEYEHGASQKNYSIGTFIPLSVFGFQPFGWQIFPMAGYTHNDGNIAVENQDPTINLDYALEPSTSNGGYMGAFALRPLTKHWTLMAFGGGSMGSDDYSGYWLGGGAGYKINDHNSFNVFAFSSDNNYGEEQKIGASYTYQFD